MDDEALGSGADVVEGEAGEQGEFVAGGGVEDAEVGGGDDLRGLDEVFEGAGWSLENDFVADANVAERAEKCVAMSGEGDVAGFAGQRRVGKMGDTVAEVCGGVSLNDDDVDVQTRDENLAERFALRWRMRICGRNSLFEMANFGGFVNAGVGEDIASVTEGENSRGEKEIKGGAENSLLPRSGDFLFLWKEIHFDTGASCAVGGVAADGV